MTDGLWSQLDGLQKLLLIITIVVSALLLAPYGGLSGGDRLPENFANSPSGAQFDTADRIPLSAGAPSGDAPQSLEQLLVKERNRADSKRDQTFARSDSEKRVESASSLADIEELLAD